MGRVRGVAGMGRSGREREVKASEGSMGVWKIVVEIIYFEKKKEIVILKVK